MSKARRAALAAALVLGAGIWTASAMAAEAIFAGGCFWCVEEAFDYVPGVTATTSGYTGGTVANPTYRQVTTGQTGHYEAVKVEYDPGTVSYAELLDVFWRNVDPFDARGQFCDKGTQYLSAVFIANADEQQLAEASLLAVANRFGMPVATRILPAQTFYPAEEYHQNFYLTNSARYRFYKFGCGRPQRLAELWGPPTT